MQYNIMMDTRNMWPEPYHVMMSYMNRTLSAEVQKPFTRTRKPPKYYIIDFGMSRQYSLDEPHPRETAPDGGDRTVPEFNRSWESVDHDPFAVDIYCVGNVIQGKILNVSYGVLF